MNKLPLQIFLISTFSALQRQLSYMDNNGSFSMFRDYQEKTPSTWATAFILQTLSEANEPDWRRILYIDVDLLNKVANWLCSQQDTETGAFYDQAPVYDRKMVNIICNKLCFLRHFFKINLRINVIYHVKSSLILFIRKSNKF